MESERKKGCESNSQYAKMSYIFYFSLFISVKAHSEQKEANADETKQPVCALLFWKEGDTVSRGD